MIDVVLFSPTVQSVRQIYTVVSVSGAEAKLELNGQIIPVHNNGYTVGEQVLFGGGDVQKLAAESSVFEI